MVFGERFYFFFLSVQLLIIIWKIKNKKNMGTTPNTNYTTDTSFGENLKILQHNDQICELQTIIRDK